MAVFKKHLTPLSVHDKPGQIHKHKGKNSTQEKLPSRHAVSSLTGGDASDRSMNEYAKETPTIQDSSKAGVGSPTMLGNDGDEDDGGMNAGIGDPGYGLG